MQHTLFLMVAASWTLRLATTVSLDAKQSPRDSTNSQSLHYVKADDTVLATLDNYPDHQVLDTVLKSSRELEEFLNREDQPIMQDYSEPCEDNELCKRSLCQWNVRVNVNLRRTPTCITYAECVHPATCDFAFRGISEHVEARLEYETTCSPVYQEFTVMIDGYEAEECYAVACVCSKPRRSGNDPRSNLRQNRTDANFQIPDTLSQPIPRDFCQQMKKTRQYKKLDANSAKPLPIDGRRDTKTAETWRQYLQRIINETTLNQP